MTYVVLELNLFRLDALHNAYFDLYFDLARFVALPLRSIPSICFCFLVNVIQIICVKLGSLDDHDDHTRFSNKEMLKV